MFTKKPFQLTVLPFFPQLVVSYLYTIYNLLATTCPPLKFISNFYESLQRWRSVIFHVFKNNLPEIGISKSFSLIFESVKLYFENGFLFELFLAIEIDKKKHWYYYGEKHWVRKTFLFSLLI